MTPKENHAAIMARSGTALTITLFRYVPAVIAARAGPRQKLIMLRDLSDQVMKEIAPNSPCQKGCSHCCHMATTISRHEAEEIGKRVNRTPKKVTALLNREAQIKRFSGKPCPFLKDNACSIYDIRPIACRIHHSIEESADPCDISKGVRDVAQVDLMKIADSVSMVTFPASLGDIREYFPPRLTPGG
jgi:Fe-S-cluster containining protein